jgi:hypothetical protein
MKATVTDFVGLMSLSMDSAGRNRGITTEWIDKNVDPIGKHLCTMKFPHNDVEWRTMWIISVLPEAEGAVKFATDAYGIPDVCIDVSDEVFDAVTKEVETDDLVDMRGRETEHADL